MFGFLFTVCGSMFFRPKGVGGLLGPLKSLCRALAKLDKKSLEVATHWPLSQNLSALARGSVVGL